MLAAPLTPYAKTNFTLHIVSYIIPFGPLSFRQPRRPAARSIAGASLPKVAFGRGSTIPGICLLGDVVMLVSSRGEARKEHNEGRKEQTDHCGQDGPHAR